VLFSDLSGYTAMNERLDPAVVAELVGHFTTAVTPCRYPEPICS
jgi:class 3 adenylate cyclase